MSQATHTRRTARIVLAAIAAVALPLALAACGFTDPGRYPNTTFAPHSEFGSTINDLWKLLLTLGTAVFIFVEGLLVYTIVRFRQRPGDALPKPVHGNTTMEILWTVIPALILVAIAIPTVKAIFATQAPAEASALQVEVYGHQWWWEFRYPQYGVTTADELYLPIGRKVNFKLQTRDVLHSFWIPELGGKRDLISNHTNYLWFTPDAGSASAVWNGTCNEYCGMSHGFMRFRTFVVPQPDFERWAAHQAATAVYTGPPPAPTPAAPGKGGSSPMVKPVSNVAPALGQNGATAQPAGPNPVTDTTAVFPQDKIPAYSTPATPIPAGLTFTPGLVGDPARGLKQFSSSMCIGCHTIKGNPMAMSPIGPNLTHVASRYTIAGSLYANDTEHLRLWIKFSRQMKPGVLMPTMGLGMFDPMLKKQVVPAMGGLTDQQIADIVAYLQSLK